MGSIDIDTHTGIGIRCCIGKGEVIGSGLTPITSEVQVLEAEPLLTWVDPSNVVRLSARLIGNTPNAQIVVVGAPWAGATCSTSIKGVGDAIDVLTLLRSSAAVGICGGRPETMFRYWLG